MNVFNMPCLKGRANAPEHMDNPDCDDAALLRTVGQFASINRLFARYPTILKRWVLADMRRDPGRDWHLLDMGAGGCDIDVWLLAAARRRGLKLHITACDADPRIVREAQRTLAHVPGLTIRHLDVLNADWRGPVDYVFGNHFLHHLSDEEIGVLIRQWVPRVARRLLFSDLARRSATYLGFASISLFYRRSFARDDGLLSIRKGFRSHELRAMAKRTGLSEHAISVTRLFPGRLLLCIDPPHAAKCSRCLEAP